MFRVFIYQKPDINRQRIALKLHELVRNRPGIAAKFTRMIDIMCHLIVGFESSDLMHVRLKTSGGRGRERRHILYGYQNHRPSQARRGNECLHGVSREHQCELTL